MSSPLFCRTYTLATDFSPHPPAPHGPDLIYLRAFAPTLPSASKRLIAPRTSASDREFMTYICVHAAIRVRPRDFFLFLLRSASGCSFRPLPPQTPLPPMGRCEPLFPLTRLRLAAAQRCDISPRITQMGLRDSGVMVK